MCKDCVILEKNGCESQNASRGEQEAERNGGSAGLLKGMKGPKNGSRKKDKDRTDY